MEQHDAVLYGADDLVLAFMRDRLPFVKNWGPCVALGVVRGPSLIGGVVFSNHHPEAKDLEMSMAFDTAAWWRPRTMARILAYPFVQLGCERLTLRIGKSNKAARTAALKTGFKLEGVRRRAHDGRQDQIIYGLLKGECRFVKKERQDG